MRQTNGNACRLSRLGYAALAALSVSCHPGSSDNTTQAVREGTSWYRPAVSTSQGGPSPMPSHEVSALDVRGVGDSAWTRGGAPGARYPTPPTARFGEALQAVDPGTTLFRSDLSFINWESVVGVRCSNIRHSVSYYFFSHPDNISQAINHGFNLFGVANNHSQDCNAGTAFSGSKTKHGALMTAEVMEKVGREHEMLWHGTGTNPFNAHTRAFSIKGQSVDVALGNLSLITWNIPNSANINIHNKNALDQAKVLLRSLQSANADFRVLSIHTQDGSGSSGEGAAFRLMKTISELFITAYNGNVVYVHGPHTWAGVKVITRADKRKGVIFASAGNFIHQGLASNGDNYLGRALFDMQSKQLQEVQVVPFRNQGAQLQFQNRSSSPIANFQWQQDTISTSDGHASRFYAKF